MSARRPWRYWGKEGDAVMSIGIAADHGGFHLKEELKTRLEEEGYPVMDFGAHELKRDDDYPDFVVPMIRSVARGELERGIAICGSGVGASVVANKVPGIRAALIHDVYSAHQGVEDDNMNILCLGGRTVAIALAADLVHAFLAARFTGAPRHKRRLAAIEAVERNG
jgi:ribose 5-phosphate isomerase B